MKVIYEYETIHVVNGGSVDRGKLKDIGKRGFHLVSVFPLTIIEPFPDGSGTRVVPNGSQLIFEKKAVL